MGFLSRELIVNWSDAHTPVKDALERNEKFPFTLLDTDKGWSHITFFRPGTPSEKVLFDVDRLEALAKHSSFYLPGDVVSQHNKIVVTATSDPGSHSAQIFGLCRFLAAYAKRYRNAKKYPELGFYGKVGGIYDRPEKGRALIIYSSSDERLLQVLEAIEAVLPAVKTAGVTLEHHLANGLSEIPRLLEGLGDSAYRTSGNELFRISDQKHFSMVLRQVREDHGKYLFVPPPR